MKKNILLFFFIALACQPKAQPQDSVLQQWDAFLNKITYDTYISTSTSNGGGNIKKLLCFKYRSKIYLVLREDRKLVGEKLLENDSLFGFVKQNLKTIGKLKRRMVWKSVAFRKALEQDYYNPLIQTISAGIKFNGQHFNHFSMSPGIISALEIPAEQANLIYQLAVKMQQAYQQQI